MMIDVQDATFEAEVIQRSMTTPVVVDLWAPWCGPCRTLGPMLEKVIGETKGKVVLAKINVDENPGASAAFQVQSIPAVYALKDGQVVDGFIGGQPEPAIREFVDKLLGDEPSSELHALLAAGDEESLRKAVELDGDSVQAVGMLAALLLQSDRAPEAVEVLAAGPEDPMLGQLLAQARELAMPSDAQNEIEQKLATLLENVKDSDDDRAEFLQLLDELSVGNPEAVADWRRKLSTRLF
ncbi:MAG: thioredoxin domain-containing protein [Acidimicrobiia bacterium]|nr:thioredoxin domain-containing protein [Acidimicrobiia bacterium]